MGRAAPQRKMIQLKDQWYRGWETLLSAVLSVLFPPWCPCAILGTLIPFCSYGMLSSKFGVRVSNIIRNYRWAQILALLLTGCVSLGEWLNLAEHQYPHLYNQRLVMRINYSLEKSLILGKIEGRGIRGRQRVRWLDGITDAMDMNLGKLQEMVRDREGLACCSPWGRKEWDPNGWLDNDSVKIKYDASQEWWHTVLLKKKNLCIFTVPSNRKTMDLEDGWSIAGSFLSSVCVQEWFSFLSHLSWSSLLVPSFSFRSSPFISSLFFSSSHPGGSGGGSNLCYAQFQSFLLSTTWLVSRGRVCSSGFFLFHSLALVIKVWFL